MGWFFYKLVFLSLAVGMFMPRTAHGQQIFYSPLPGIRAATTQFEIIGKYNNRQLIYTKNFSSRQITCYNDRMEPVDTVPLDFLPYDLKNVHFIALHDSFIMIYQYVEKRDIYCKVVRFNKNVEQIAEPRVIDKTRHPFEIIGDLTYSDVVSKDKNRVMIYKIIKKQGDKLLTVKTFLLDSSLNLVQKGQVSFSYDYDNTPRQIRLSDKGGLYFLYGSNGSPYQDFFEGLTLFYKPAHENKLQTRALIFKDRPPSSRSLLTLNERDQRLWINTFNFDGKKRHLVSLNTYQFDMDSIKQLQKTRQEFSAGIRKSLAENKRLRKFVFDHYVPRKLIFNRSGSALLVAEKEFEDSDKKTYFGSIGLFSLDETGRLKGIQSIEKEQGQYGYTHSGSFLVVNNGKALHFLVNKSHGVTRFLNNHIYLLRDYRFLQDKTLEKMPLMAHMDKGFKMLPGLGKQTGINEAVIPCLSGGNLIFAGIFYGKLER